MFQEKFYQVRVEHIFSRFQLSHARSSNIIDVIYFSFKMQSHSLDRGTKLQLLYRSPPLDRDMP